MQPRIVGEHPLAQDANGRLKSRIATVFPYVNTIVTLPGIHATQRMAFVELLSKERQERGQAPLSREEEEAVWHDSVDLIVDRDMILIRPDPNNMGLAFHGDDILQRLVPKHRIRFLLARDERVRSAIKRRGECWRICTLPTTPAEMREMIADSKAGIGGAELYYYSKATGTRYLTYENFARLGLMTDEDMRLHLLEIQEHSSGINRLGKSEIAFFAADATFSKSQIAAYDFAGANSRELREIFETLLEIFHHAVPPELLHDDLNQSEWRNRMYAALIGEDEHAISEEALLGLSSEFFMQIEWLPGGRIQEGELIFDSAFELAEECDDPRLLRLCNAKSHGFIFNFVREFGNLEYVNMGRVVESLSHRRESPGRRDVFIAQIKQQGVKNEIIKIIRMQKWGIREHLDAGASLLDAIIRSEEYTEYVLDRRLACRQLGMNLPPRTTAKRISERYCGMRNDLCHTRIWSPYFERDYIRGMATDKIPSQYLADPAFASRLARLLGRTAAPNMIVGRCDLHGCVVFDDGDEVVVSDENNLPADIVVADQMGTFGDYRTNLEHFASAYAMPINRRFAILADPHEFATLYIEAFGNQFARIQQEYRKRKRAFDTLFKHRPRDEAGSLAFRWECVLARLQRTSPQNLGNLIRSHLTF